MTHDDLKQCPYCAEFIKRDAIKCPYCNSMLTEQTQQPHAAHWTRPVHDKTIAGVCSGIARELNMSQLVIPLRLFFILTTLFWGFGPIFYIILIFLMPAERLTPGMQPRNTSVSPPPPSPHSVNHSLVYALIILAAMGVIFVLIASGFNYHIPLPFGMHPPGIHLPRNILFDILPHGTFYWNPLPGPVVLLLVLLVAIVLFSMFKAFRVALGCFGVMLLSLIFVFILLPMTPILIVPIGMISLVLIMAGIVFVFVKFLGALFG